MENSNIIANSNIFPCDGNPLYDEAFMRVVQDYLRLKEAYDKTKAVSEDVYFSKIQKEIIKTDMRCTFAKNDPCWGYVDGFGTSCKCIKSSCSMIKQCNPTFDIMEEYFWTLDPIDSEQYGSPELQRKYYLVDLTSNKEKDSYECVPEPIGRKFNVENEVKEISKKKKHEKVIIGYERTRFNDYCDEQIKPILGYVDIEENLVPVWKTTNSSSTTKMVLEKSSKDAKSLEEEVTTPMPTPAKKKRVREKKVASVSDVHNEKTIEDAVLKNIFQELKLTEISEDLLYEISEEGQIIVITANPAESSYISSMLQKNDIGHGLNLSDYQNIDLILCDMRDLEEKYLDRLIVLSNTVIKNGCNANTISGWSKLINAKKIIKLNIPHREYVCFEFDKNKSRWGCQNLYGMTHLCLTQEDICLNKSLEDGEYEILCVEDLENNEYKIVESHSAMIIGSVNTDFMKSLEYLKEKNEITNYPALISELVLEVMDQRIQDIKGIGHMKYDEY